MTAVGIIANPDSGRDVRRVIARALTVDNQQKVNLIMRMLTALDWLEIETVWLMPDRHGLGRQAVAGLGQHPAARRAQVLDMATEWAGADTTRAAAQMAECGVGCIIVIGGDGTARLAAKACGDIPLLPVSTGTNNVVPSFVEGTVAGLAAGLVARSAHTPLTDRCWRHKKLLIHIDGALQDEALVDIAVVESGALGVRAVWDQPLRQVFVTRAHPTSTGLSSIIGFLVPISPHQPSGAVALLAPDAHHSEAALHIDAPINAGSLSRIWLETLMPLEPGVPHAIKTDGGGKALALAPDGERELLLRPDTQAAVTLTAAGPWLVDVERTMERAALEGIFSGQERANLQFMENWKGAHGC